MILSLTDLSDESLQSQIARQIRAKVLAGELGAENALPSIRSLAREQRISVITVQRAYEVLERDGLIHSRRGKGFFVSQLSEETKKEMAKGRLAKKLGPQLKAAIAEGLSTDDISDVLSSLLNDRKG